MLLLLILVDKSSVGIGNVDNTSDLNKPISTAVQTAINLKVDKSYVDNADLLKADKSYVDNADLLKADKSYVDNALVLKADKTYVDSKSAPQLWKFNDDYTINTSVTTITHLISFGVFKIAIHGFLYDNTNNELYRFMYMNPSVVGSLAKFVITVEQLI